MTNTDSTLKFPCYWCDWVEARSYSYVSYQVKERFMIVNFLEEILFQINLNEFETPSVSGDVLATVLALYMHDKDQPLPSQEEVLICTPETTTEEVTWNATRYLSQTWQETNLCCFALFGHSTEPVFLIISHRSKQCFFIVIKIKHWLPVLWRWVSF